MEIYVDYYYSNFLIRDTFKSFSNIDNIPDNVDVIAISRFTNNLSEHQKVIDQLLPKTKKLIYTIGEAVNHNLVDFLLKNNDPKIEFLIDAVPNISIPNVKSISSWFMSPINFYADFPPLLALADKLEHSISKPKFFDCLLGVKKDHRDQIQRFYKNSKHKDKFIFTYFKDNIHTGEWDTQLPDELEFSGERITYQGQQIPLSAILPVDIYNQSYYSVVAETTDYNDFNQYTEKVAKPMLAKRLFIVFAGQYYLRNLREKGFMTFDNVIDESYDSIEDPDIRFYQAWQQIEYLCEQDPAEIMAKIEPIVKHNRQHFLDTDWHANLKAHFKNASRARLHSILAQQPGTPRP